MALSPEQRRVLREITAAPLYARATPKVRKALIEAGLVESNLSTPNQAASDRDSEGVLQQRPSQGWGPTSESNTTDAEQFLRRAMALRSQYGNAGDLAQAVQRSAFPGRYNQRGGQAASILQGLGGDVKALTNPAQASTSRTVTTTPGVDNSDARRQALSAFLLGGTDPTTGQQTSGDILQLALQMRQLKDVPAQTSTVRTPARGNARSASVRPSGVTGRVKFAPGADRPGVSTQQIVKSFIAQVAGHAQRPITIGTGTNHNQMTTSGNVSDHWTGHAADLPQAVDSHEGDMVAAHALQVAGIPWNQAVHMAQKGGVFNVTPTSGPYKGHRIQVLWKTNVGGNHHNHVHVGIR